MHCLCPFAWQKVFRTTIWSARLLIVFISFVFSFFKTTDWTERQRFLFLTDLILRKYCVVAPSREGIPLSSPVVTT